MDTLTSKAGTHALPHGFSIFASLMPKTHFCRDDPCGFDCECESVQRGNLPGLCQQGPYSEGECGLQDGSRSLHVPRSGLRLPKHSECRVPQA